MPATHCLPSGALGTSELPVPNVSAANLTTYTPSGSKRGVVVLLHGLNIVGVNIPIVPTGAMLTLAGTLQTDGWVVINPTFSEDLYSGALPTTGLYNDINADTGHGSRYLTNMLAWWDHVVAYINQRYGNWPIVPFGLSWGAWHAYQIAKNKQSTIIGYGGHVGVTVLSGVASALTTPVDFTGLNTTGLDLASTALNAVTKPGMIGWGTADTVVGSTNLSALYTAAHNAGQPVTSNATGDTHQITGTDATTYQSWFTSTIDPLAPASF